MNLLSYGQTLRKVDVSYVGQAFMGKGLADRNPRLARKAGNVATTIDNGGEK